MKNPSKNDKIYKERSCFMKCILMNKNTEILIAEYDSELSTFSEIIK